MSRALRTHRFLCLIVATAFLSLIGRGALAQQCDAPEPDFKIIPAAASVAPDAAAFSGVWAGNWLLPAWQLGNRTSQCAIIHISVEDSDHAAVAYCYGTRSDLQNAAQCDLYQAVIRAPYLIFFTTDGVNISLRLKGPSTAQVQADFPHLPTILTNFQKR